MTGFSRMPSDSQTWLPAENLQDFLKGTPPIYIGFGSLVNSCPKAVVEIIVKVLKNKKIKTLIQNTLPGINEMELPNHIFLTGYVPHDWLFSQVKAVIHHGGVGTTAAGLFAGKPTLVMPFLLDQFFWAKKIHEWGIGPNPLPIKQCNENAFELRLKQLLDNALYQKKAELMMTDLLNDQDGTEVAYQVLKACLETPKYKK